ncbi:MAG: hypothetical protein KBS61_05255 [Chryseobacterium sp.]|nr:hypothetical protein [Candidatus Chryseobacterium enterohippi]
MKVGEDFFSALKKNNTTVWVTGIIAISSILGSLFFSYTVYKDSTSNIYSINEKGDLIPLKKLEIQNADLIQAKSNLELFIDQYYTLDAFSMKKKRERILWLVGDQPTKIIKDRATKGYFDEFLSIAGLTQNAEILQQTLKISKEAPYNAEFVVRIQRVNGGVSEFYNSSIKLKMERVNRNFPYNPYGLLITQFSENLQRVDVKSESFTEDTKASEEEINQNPKENGSQK